MNVFYKCKRIINYIILICMYNITMQTDNGFLPVFICNARQSLRFPTDFSYGKYEFSAGVGIEWVMLLNCCWKGQREAFPLQRSFEGVGVAKGFRACFRYNWLSYDDDGCFICCSVVRVLK